MTASGSACSKVFVYREPDCESLSITTISRPGFPRAIYMYDNTSLYEVQKFKKKYSSWLTNDSIINDGSLHYVTRVDPNFVLLPILEKARKKTVEHPGFYTNLDSVFCDSTKDLQNIGTIDQLRLICDVNDKYGEPMIRLNDEKVVKFLRAKAVRISHHLSKRSAQKFNSQSDMLISPSTAKEEVETKDTCEREISLQRDHLVDAIGIMSEYVAKEWVEKLAKSYDLNWSDILTASKRTQAEQPKWKATDGIDTSNVTNPAPVSNLTPVPQVFTEDRSAMKRAAAEMRAKEAKKAQKIAENGKGMKKLTSFFAPKAS